LREDLFNDETSLELKNISSGIISWSTRDQVGIGSELRAITGFQNKFYNQSELIEMFINQIEFGNDLRHIEYLQMLLRTTIDIMKHGGHVMRKYKDQRFSLVYDNRREILDQDLINTIFNYKSKLNKVSNLNKDFFILNEPDKFVDVVKVIDDDDVNIVNDTKSIGVNKVPPIKLTIVKNLNNSKALIENTIDNNLNKKFQITSENSVKIYLLLNIVKLVTILKYKDYKDTRLRNFIKGLLKKLSLYPDIASELSNYQLIIDFIYGYDSMYKINKFSLSKLNN